MDKLEALEALENAMEWRPEYCKRRSLSERIVRALDSSQLAPLLWGKEGAKPVMAARRKLIELVKKEGKD